MCWSEMGQGAHRPPRPRGLRPGRVEPAPSVPSAAAPAPRLTGWTPPACPSVCQKQGPYPLPGQLRSPLVPSSGPPWPRTRRACPGPAPGLAHPNASGGSGRSFPDWGIHGVMAYQILDFHRAQIEAAGTLAQPCSEACQRYQDPGGAAKPWPPTSAPPRPRSLSFQSVELRPQLWWGQDNPGTVPASPPAIPPPLGQVPLGKWHPEHGRGGVGVGGWHSNLWNLLQNPGSHWGGVWDPACPPQVVEGSEGRPQGVGWSQGQAPPRAVSLDAAGPPGPGERPKSARFVTGTSGSPLQEPPPEVGPRGREEEVPCCPGVTLWSHTPPWPVPQVWVCQTVRISLRLKIKDHFCALAGL